MGCDIREGCFTNVKCQAFVDYLVKAGVPKSDAEKMLGTHWSVRVEKTDDGAWVGFIRCDEMSSMNSLETFREGQEKDVDHPLFGGKAKVTFQTTSPNSFKCKSVSETFGVSEWTETYTEEGVTFDFSHQKSGATLKEFWPRKVAKSGVWFEMCKAENLEAYSKAAGWPDGMNPLTEGFRVRFDMCGDTCKMTELFGKQEVITRCKLDEETDYDKGGPMEAKFVVTKTGDYTSKWIFKSKRGQEIWDMKFGMKGLFYTGTHSPSGQNIKIWARPVTHVFGTWRILTSANMVPYMAALGVPHEIGAKMEAEHDARLEMINEGNGWVRSKFSSKYMPMDLAFKWGEQYEHSMPLPGGAIETFKCIDTLEGDTVLSVWKSSKATVTSEVKFTGDWAICTYTIKGSGISCKQIMERC